GARRATRAPAASDAVAAAFARDVPEFVPGPPHRGDIVAFEPVREEFGNGGFARVEPDWLLGRTEPRGRDADSRGIGPGLAAIWEPLGRDPNEPLPRTIVIPITLPFGIVTDVELPIDHPIAVRFIDSMAPDFDPNEEGVITSVPLPGDDQ
ncbi:MAG: hypothetical protein AAFU70_13215, partial [Planctomycetota bacterium]